MSTTIPTAIRATPDRPAREAAISGIKIVCEKFNGMGRLDRHRLINDALADELAGPVHALSIVALTPDEDASRGA